MTSIRVNGCGSYGPAFVNGGCSDGTAPIKGGLLCGCENSVHRAVVFKLIELIFRAHNSTELKIVSVYQTHLAQIKTSGDYDSQMFRPRLN